MTKKIAKKIKVIKRGIEIIKANKVIGEDRISCEKCYFVFAKDIWDNCPMCRSKKMKKEYTDQFINATSFGELGELKIKLFKDKRPVYANHFKEIQHAYIQKHNGLAGRN